MIDIPYLCEDCGRELTHMTEEQLCEACRHQREVDELEGVSVDLEFCEVCEGILHPQHRAAHHT